MEQNKHQGRGLILDQNKRYVNFAMMKSSIYDVFLLSVLPQLRSVTSMELGCDPKGYSRAGNDTTVWYCAVVIGRQSAELHKMREVSSIFPYIFYCYVK